MATACSTRPVQSPQSSKHWRNDTTRETVDGLLVFQALCRPNSRLLVNDIASNSDSFGHDTHMLTQLRVQVCLKLPDSSPLN